MSEHRPWKILIIEPNVAARAALTEAFVDHSTTVVSTAQDAVAVANETEFSVILLELSLKGHSGMEFLYEFRSYADWATVPVIVYTSIQLESDILESDTWKALNVRYAYKPDTSLAQLISIVEGLVV